MPAWMICGAVSFGLGDGGTCGGVREFLWAVVLGPVPLVLALLVISGRLIMRVISLLLAFCAVASLGTLPSAEGQSCVRNRAVFCPTVRTYATTAAYVAPAVAYHAAAVQVIEVPVALDYYYSLNSFNQAALISDAVVGKLALLDQQQRRGVDTPSRKQAAIPPKGTPVIPGSDEPDAKLAAVVGKSCISCHSAAKKSGGLDLSDLRAMSEFQRLKCSNRVLRGEMPPQPRDPLSNEEAALFSEWASNFKGSSRVELK